MVLGTPFHCHSLLTTWPMSLKNNWLRRWSFSQKTMVTCLSTWIHLNKECKRGFKLSRCSFFLYLFLAKVTYTNLHISTDCSYFVARNTLLEIDWSSHSRHHVYLCPASAKGAMRRRISSKKSAVPKPARSTAMNKATIASWFWRSGMYGSKVLHWTTHWAPIKASWKLGHVLSTWKWNSWTANIQCWYQPSVPSVLPCLAKAQRTSGVCHWMKLCDLSGLSETSSYGHHKE